jgi:hypothetical protein
MESTYVEVEQKQTDSYAEIYVATIAISEKLQKIRASNYARDFVIMEIKKDWVREPIDDYGTETLIKNGKIYMRSFFRSEISARNFARSMRTNQLRRELIEEMNGKGSVCEQLFDSFPENSEKPISEYMENKQVYTISDAKLILREKYGEKTYQAIMRIFEKGWNNDEEYPEESPREKADRLFTKAYESIEEEPPSYYCVYCDNEIDPDGLRKDPEGRYVCQDCFDENYLECEECGRVVEKDDTREAEWTTYCESCFDQLFTVCFNCGATIRRERACTVEGSYSDRDYCQTCFNELFVTCERCGEPVDIDEAMMIDDEYYCQSCYDENYREDIIRDYHASHGGALNFLGSPIDRLWMGMELEVDKGGCIDEKAKEISEILGEDRAFFERDGTIGNGFEIISHPFSMAYWKREHGERYKAACKRLLEMGYRSNDTESCGLHIHVSRTGLGEDIDERDKTLGKIYILLNRFWEEIFRFSRRKRSQLESYAKMYDAKPERDESAKSVAEKIKYEANGDRYRAINLCNSNTVEFRIYKGTLKYSTIDATVSFTHGLVSVARNAPEATIEGIRTFDDLIRMIYAYGAGLYSDNLELYCLARGLIKKMTILEEEDHDDITEEYTKEDERRAI